MATEEATAVHPGDIIQDSQGLLYLASEVHGWGVGAVQRFAHQGDVLEAYHRLKPGQFVVVGAAHMLPPELAAARKDSIATERAIAKEAAK